MIRRPHTRPPWHPRRWTRDRRRSLVVSAAVATLGVFSLALVPWIGESQMSPGTVYSRLMDGAGNRLDSATSAPAGTERGLIVRPIPSGTQNTNVAQWGGTGTSLGQKTMSASVPVVIASDQSTLPVTQGALTVIATGQQAVTTTASALPSNTAQRVCLKNLVASTQTVYFGASGVTTGTGQELAPGDSWCGPLDNTNKIFVIAAASGATVAFDVLR